MREILKSFSEDEHAGLKIHICGMSYCDSSYKIDRKQSKVYCFGYVISGKGTLITKNGKANADAGDVFFFKKDEDHFYQADAKTPWTLIWFNVSGELIEKLTLLYGVDKQYLFKNCRIFSLFDEFNKNVDSVIDKRTIIDRNAIVLHQIIQAMAECASGSDSQDTSDAQTIREYIDENYSKPIYIEQLASLINHSQSQTIRIFKKFYNQTPYEYALKRKMHVAKQLLKSTKLSVREISNELGFSNEHYFSTCFKKQVGMTPGKYRK